MAEEKKKKIKDDPKWEFIGNYCSKSMNLKPDKFQKIISTEEVKVSF